MAKSRNSIRLEAMENIDLEIGMPLSARRTIARILKRDYAARKAIAYPSQAVLSTEIGVSRASVKRAVRWGQDLGIFTVDRKAGGRNEYKIDYPRLEKLNKLWVQAAELRADTVSID